MKSDILAIKSTEYCASDDTNLMSLSNNKIVILFRRKPAVLNKTTPQRQITDVYGKFYFDPTIFDVLLI